MTSELTGEELWTLAAPEEAARVIRDIAERKAAKAARLIAEEEAKEARKTNAAVDTVYKLTHPTPAGDWFSVAVHSDGSYGIEKGLIFSYPIRSNGKDFEIALTALNDLGYAVDAFILNAVRWTPQSRARLFVVAKLTSAGVQFQRYDFLKQDDLGVWTAPGGAKVAWFKDPDGNILHINNR